jgi:hypothetical protein
MGVILRKKVTKNLIIRESAEILGGDYPAYIAGLRMTWRSCQMGIHKKNIPARGITPVSE